ncbi:MAG: O-antigen ligase family protein [Parcubacteria group bacterium]
MKINWEKILFWILLSVVITLPLQVTELLFPVHILGSRFPVLEFSRILTAVGILVLGIKLLVTKKILIPKDLLSILLYVFVVINGLSLAFFPSSSGLVEVLRYTFYLGFFFITVNAVKNLGYFENLVRAFLIAGSAISVFSIFQYFGGFYLWNAKLGLVISRVNATFIDPNVLATFLGILIVIATAYYSYVADKRYRILSALVALSSLAALFYTFSRAGLVSFVAAFLFLITVLPKNLKMLILYVVLALVAGVVYFSSGEVRERTSNIYDIIEGTALNSDATFVAIRYESFSDTSSGEKENKEEKFRSISAFLDRILSFLPFNYDRTSTVKAGILMFLDRPVFGVGLGNFQEVYTIDYSYLIDFRRKPSQGDPITLLHSSFAALIAELGLVGLIWLSTFLLTSAQVFIRAYRDKGSPSRIFILASVASLLLMFIHTQFRGSLFSDPYFWLLNGFMVIGERISSAKSK